jgi:1-deoxy-D-xylulose-5-phosphate reductoisomerase
MATESTKKIIVLGATGSIGKGACEVIAAHPDRFSLVAASAHSDAEGLSRVAREFGLSRVCLSGAAAPLDGFDFSAAGSAGLERLVRETEADIVLNAVAGAAGLFPSAWALDSGKDLALANKETMVAAGELVKDLAKKRGRRILPVDSEHSAVFQLINQIGADKVDEIILTASGGPFRDWPLDRFAGISLADALRHPNWSMGKKITVDSASMANKGLEVLEALELFPLGLGAIKVLIHRESKVHSLVRSRDGSLYAQLSEPDMRLPIQNALSWPGQLESPYGRLDLAGLSLSFEEPDTRRFPLLALAYEVGKRGGAYPVAYNAANEVAVGAFMAERLPFVGISEVVARTLESDFAARPESFDAVAEADARARRVASGILERR